MLGRNPRAPSRRADDAGRVNHTTGPRKPLAGSLDMGSNNARALAIRLIAAGIGIGAIAGLVIGGIREVWLWRR